MLLRRLPAGIERDLIAQEIGDQLLARAVDDVAAVVVDALLVRRLVDDVPDLVAEHLVDRPHLLGVAGDEIIVDGDDVHRLARPRPDRGGQRRR